MVRLVLVVCAARALAEYCPPPSAETWMEEMWPWIKDRQIVGLMLPGSHNSGAVKSMSHRGRCGAIYGKFKSDIKAAVGPFLESLVTDTMLQTYYQPWNVNQHLGIYDQLAKEGVRFFHLKFCNFVNENDKMGPFDLNHLYHSHGGYTSMSLASVFDDILRFLDEHPLEFVVVGLNNFWEIDNAPELAASVARHLNSTNVSLVRSQDWSNSLGDLAEENRRLVIFVPESQTEGILPSEQYLIENWDGDEMGSDDFDRVKRYLIQDATTYAQTPRDKFYAFSAHPTVNRVDTVNANIVAKVESVLGFSRDAHALLVRLKDRSEEISKDQSNNKSAVLDAIKDLIPMVKHGRDMAKSASDYATEMHHMVEESEKTIRWACAQEEDILVHTRKVESMCSVLIDQLGEIPEIEVTQTSERNLPSPARSKNTDTLTPDKVFGQSSDPMLDFQLGWFNNSNYFPSFVEEMMENYSSLVLNSISTDFVELSGSFELTMRLQSFCNTTTTTQTTSTAVST
ncbi:PI-PLC X domain-containing protein 1 [Symbiodinium microadriaticum]|uniref:PI-PLC X domain-containing protein 1 n=1 Tax=Symbiodinium microadriaticum TaxID=2951 RepID=A0A1Q9D005_SYMMI|nr:PI-PLC X domain-containing protein 1 [Symbiodinium microadriaticum]